MTPELQKRINKACEDAVKKWGSESQFRMVQEECAELIAAISQWVRGRVYRDAIAEEVADVIIVLTQARHMIGERAVDAFLLQKIERLEQRIEENEKK